LVKEGVITMRRSTIMAAAIAASLVLLPLVPARAGPSPVWIREAGTSLNDVATVPGGAIAVTGYRLGGAMLVRVYGVGGALRWSRTWMPKGKTITGSIHATGRGVAAAPDGSIYVGGVVNASCEGGAWFLRKYGPNGGLRWHREGGGWRTCDATTSIHGIAADRGGVVVTMQDVGCCDDPRSEGWVRAFAPNGRVRWTNPFEVPWIPRERYDAVNDVAIDAAGSVYAVGRVSRTPEQDLSGPFDRDVVIQKLTLAGRLLWTRLFRRPDLPFEDATSVSVRGTRVMAGGWVRGADVSASWLRRLTTGGAVLRTWRWGGLGVSGVALSPTLATYVTFGTRAGGAVRKLGPGGAVVWTTVLRPEVGRSSYTEGVATDPGGASVAGSVDQASPPGRLWRFRA
jgi:hypothetical protein